MVMPDADALEARLAGEVRRYLEEADNRDVLGRSICESLSSFLERLLQDGRHWNSGALWSTKYSWLDGVSARELVVIGDEVHIVGGAWVDAVALAPIQAMLRPSRGGQRMEAYGIRFGDRRSQPMSRGTSVFDLRIPERPDDWAYAFER